MFGGGGLCTCSSSTSINLANTHTRVAPFVRPLSPPTSLPPNPNPNLIPNPHHPLSQATSTNQPTDTNQLTPTNRHQPTPTNTNHPPIQALLQAAHESTGLDGWEVTMVCHGGGGSREAALALCCAVLCCAVLCCAVLHERIDWVLLTSCKCQTSATNATTATTNNRHPTGGRGAPRQAVGTRRRLSAVQGGGGGPAAGRRAAAGSWREAARAVAGGP